MEVLKQAVEIFFDSIGLGVLIGMTAGWAVMTYRLCRKIF